MAPASIALADRPARRREATNGPAIHDDCEGPPTRRVGVELHAPLDPTDDHVELAVVDPVSEDHPVCSR
ncbi:MAG TPA: hypothetical protein VEF89_10240 [Solirubrobacteraceae bacterium]|nr:hypothetical protein [Solirubrobacteraceae bacterium]